MGDGARSPRAMWGDLGETLGRVPRRVFKNGYCNADALVKLDDYGAGSTRNNAPSSSSVSRYSRLSGPCRTSRIRCRNSHSNDSRRISSILLLKTMRSMWPVPGISPVRMEPTNTLPFHFGNRSPVYTAIPATAMEGIHVTNGDSNPSRTGYSEMRGPE